MLQVSTKRQAAGPQVCDASHIGMRDLLGVVDASVPLIRDKVVDRPDLNGHDRLRASWVAQNRAFREGAAPISWAAQMRNEIGIAFDQICAFSGGLCPAPWRVLRKAPSPRGVR